MQIYTSLTGKNWKFGDGKNAENAWKISKHILQ